MKIEWGHQKHDAFQSVARGNLIRFYHFRMQFIIINIINRMCERWPSWWLGPLAVGTHLAILAHFNSTNLQVPEQTGAGAWQAFTQPSFEVNTHPFLVHVPLAYLQASEVAFSTQHNPFSYLVLCESWVLKLAQLAFFLVFLSSCHVVIVVIYHIITTIIPLYYYTHYYCKALGVPRDQHGFNNTRVIPCNYRAFWVRCMRHGQSTGIPWCPAEQRSDGSDSPTWGCIPLNGSWLAIFPVAYIYLYNYIYI